MMNFYFDLFPNGKKKACVFSFDDNKITDKKMAEIFDKYGAKCTFNVNSSAFDKEGHLDKSFIRELSLSHEIASHSVSHLFMERNPNFIIESEIVDDKKAIEDVIGKAVYGFAYPFGTFDERIERVLQNNGFVYSRTVNDTFSFGYPQKYLEWHPSCHQSKAISGGVIEKFLSRPWPLENIFIWGHSREFDGNWQNLTDILDRLKGCDDIWYCTSYELYSYKKALDGLVINENGEVVNNGNVSVFAHLNGKIVEIKTGINKF